MDFEKEGLLDGLSGSERQARVELLTRLVESGTGLAEIKQARDEGRLALLPAEQLLASESKYTAREIAEKVGIEPELFLTIRRASGLPIDDLDRRGFDDADVEAATAIATFVNAGLPEEGLVEMARIFGELASRTSAATRSFMAETALSTEGIDENTLGIQLAEAARNLRPLTEFLIQYLYRLHMREQLRNEMAISARLEAGSMPGLQEVTVGFVDLVGFTSLGEEIPPDALGGLAGRLATLIGDEIEAPVRLTKMIGDAGMLVSEDNGALLDTALRLVDAAERIGDGFPGLKAGVASGEALHKWGDWYGNPVNVASRVTSIARPGSVLATKEVRDASREDYEWSLAGERKLKGVSAPVRLYRARLP